MTAQQVIAMMGEPMRLHVRLLAVAAGLILSAGCREIGTLDPSGTAQADLVQLGTGPTFVALCHADRGRDPTIILVGPTAAAAHIAHGDARPGSPVPGQPDMILTQNCASVSTSPVTIAFDGLSNNGSAFTGYSQGGFTVSPTAGHWRALTTYGNPLPSIIFNRSAAQPTITAAVTITASGSEFRFQSVDLYSSITTIPYVFTGRLKSNQVFSVSAEEGNTFGSFVTVPNP